MRLAGPAAQPLTGRSGSAVPHRAPPRRSRLPVLRSEHRRLNGQPPPRQYGRSDSTESPAALGRETSADLDLHRLRCERGGGCEGRRWPRGSVRRPTGCAPAPSVRRALPRGRVTRRARQPRAASPLSPRAPRTPTQGHERPPPGEDDSPRPRWTRASARPPRAHPDAARAVPLLARAGATSGPPAAMMRPRVTQRVIGVLHAHSVCKRLQIACRRILAHRCRSGDSTDGEARVERIRPRVVGEVAHIVERRAIHGSSTKLGGVAPGPQ